MIRKTVILLLITAITALFNNTLQAGNSKLLNEKDLVPKPPIGDTLKWSIHFLNKLIYSRGEWYFTDHTSRKPIKGILNYAENAPLDTIMIDMQRLLNDRKVELLIERRPQDISNTKDIPEYLSAQEISRCVDNIRLKIIDSLNISNIRVPLNVLEAALYKAPRVPDGTPHELLSKKLGNLPPEFVTSYNHQLNSLQFAPDMSSAAKDTARYQVFVSCRKAFNDSVQNNCRERATFAYRMKFLNDLIDLRTSVFKRSAEEKNQIVLNAYNDKSVKRVNDSLRIALQYLTVRAGKDSSLIRLFNLSNEKTDFWTANREMKPIRMFLKNAQNDSLSVVLLNNGKDELKLVIDDGIKLTRFKESQNRTVTFETKAPDKKLHKVKMNVVVLPPWTLVGNGSVGFTQTSLSNWAKGGESALALLVMSKYNANYSKNKIKWENSAEIRYGISQTKTRGLEKNDDKFELQSRFGYSAFKKWYYSGETNFRTQIANGYTFPDKSHPISAFMSPGYWTMSIGMDYKPNKDFSLFLSPFTSKTTYVLDTALISPTKYGVEAGKTKLWEPGMIAKANWHRNLAENINYDTRAEFFNNYRYTLEKFAFEWEQVLIMQVNRFINARVMTQLIYDYNTKFPIKDVNGKEIGRKPKWQFKELFTIGLSYKF